MSNLTEVWATRHMAVYGREPARECDFKKIPVAIPVKADLWADVVTRAEAFDADTAGESLAILGHDALMEKIAAELRKRHPDCSEIALLTGEESAIYPAYVYRVRVRFYRE